VPTTEPAVAQPGRAVPTTQAASVQPESLVPPTRPAVVQPWRLQGIFYSAAPSAIVNGKTVHIGDEILGHFVMAISAREVTLQNQAGETNVLSLK